MTQLLSFSENQLGNVNEDLDHCTVVSARQAGLSILGPPDFLGFLCLDFTVKNVVQFCVGEDLRITPESIVAKFRYLRAHMGGRVKYMLEKE